VPALKPLFCLFKDTLSGFVLLFYVGFLLTEKVNNGAFMYIARTPTPYALRL